MKPIIIVSPRICKALSIFIEVGAITLYPFIISREPMSDVTLNHEKIHLEQQREGFILGFYALYLFYWGMGIAKGYGTSMAYYRIPYEQEAYDNHDNMNYLETRERNAWKKYRL
tara:strand:+ start:437 stop:778 length:342 start_codon:yes stop_codon:yes gene_type:complete